MRLILLNPIRWLSGCLIFLLTACSQTPAYQEIQVTKEDSINNQLRIIHALDTIAALQPLIHNGDLITRTGNDFTSETFRNMNRRDNSYSHCGIASLENDSIVVYHALGGEWNPDQKIRRDPFAVFAEPLGNKGIGLFRYRVADTVINAILDSTRACYKKGIMFDMKFDLATDDRMYCAEFIMKCLNRGSRNLLQFEPGHIGDFDFVAVDDLHLHPLCQPLRRIVYK